MSVAKRLIEEQLAEPSQEEMAGIEECGNCCFMRGSNHYKGYCHRYAPRPGNHNDRWPLVELSDWCGEYEKE